MFFYNYVLLLNIKVISILQAKIIYRSSGNFRVYKFSRFNISCQKIFGHHLFVRKIFNTKFKIRVDLVYLQLSMVSDRKGREAWKSSKNPAVF